MPAFHLRNISVCRALLQNFPGEGIYGNPHFSEVSALRQRKFWGGFSLHLLILSYLQLKVNMQSSMRRKRRGRRGVCYGDRKMAQTDSISEILIQLFWVGTRFGFFLTSWQLLLVGAILHLKKDCGRKEDEKGTGVNQLRAPTCYGKWKLPAKVQTTLKIIRHSRTKLVFLANDCPVLRKSGIEDGAMLAKTGIHHYSCNNIELSTACGKYHRIRSTATIDPGILVSLEACRNRWVNHAKCYLNKTDQSLSKKKKKNVTILYMPSAETNILIRG